MGAAKRIKQILIDKDMTQKEFADMVYTDKAFPYSHLRNMLAKDTLRFSTVEEWLDALDYDIVFIDRKTKKQFRP